MSKLLDVKLIIIFVLTENNVNTVSSKEHLNNLLDLLYYISSSPMLLYWKIDIIYTIIILILMAHLSLCEI